MSLTFNLILALFLLAPGLGIFAGIYSGSRRPFTPAPAEPGSIHTLAVVSIGALLVHAIWAWIFVAMQSSCVTHVCAQVSFDPNPYETILHIRDVLSGGASSAAQVAKPPPADVTPSGLAWMFSSLLIIGFSGFLLGLAAIALIHLTGLVRGAVYGWVDELVSVATTDAHVFTAYVLTDTEENGLLLGYEGSLIDLRQAPDGAIRLVVIRDCEPFVVKMKEDSALRVPGAPPKPIPLLTIEGAHIKNIAFQAYLDVDRLSRKERAKLEAAGDLDAVATPEEPNDVRRRVPTPRRDKPKKRAPKAAAPTPAGTKPHGS